eukprot:6182058-Pleurochrysis_carterae.AAC.2
MHQLYIVRISAPCRCQCESHAKSSERAIERPQTLPCKTDTTIRASALAQLLRQQPSITTLTVDDSIRLYPVASICVI